MDSKTMRYVIMNEEQLIADAFYGNNTALKLLESAYESGYESKFISEDWQKFLSRNSVLHPINGIRNFVDNLIANHHSRKIRKINRKIQKEDEALKQAHKLGADRETVQNHLDRIKELGDDERQDRLIKYRNRKLNILNRKTGNDARGEYELEDKNGSPISIYQAINDKELNPYARKGWSPDNHYDEMEKRYRLHQPEDNETDDASQPKEPAVDGKSMSGNSESQKQSDKQSDKQNKTDEASKEQGKEQGSSKQSSISTTGKVVSSDDPNSGNYNSVKAKIQSQTETKPDNTSSETDSPSDNSEEAAPVAKPVAKSTAKVTTSKSRARKKVQAENVARKISRIRQMLQESKYAK